MTIKQNKGQTILYAIITLIAVIGLFCFAIFDMRKLPHDYSFILDNVIIYWGFRVLCFVGGFFAAAGDIYLFKQIFSKDPLIVICDEYFYDNSSAISLGKIAWSEMERDAFNDLISDYEELNGNGHVHTVVIPDMNMLRVIRMNDLESLAELFHSREV
jgi:hypothetical protein